MKLLHYTSLRHLLFAALLTLISIPLFYILLNNIFVHSIDRDLKMQAEKIPTSLSIIKTPADLALWRELDNDLKILPLDSVARRHKPYTIKKKEPGHKGTEDYRIYQKQVQIMGRPYIVAIESSLFEKEDLVRTILSIQLGILVLLLLGTVIINYLINKKVWRPFYEALAYLKAFNIETGTTELKLPDPIKIKEFKELSHSIKLQATRVRAAYDSQKEFIENASHELQTPLTVLKFKLELLLQRPDLGQDESVLVMDMYREIEQMQDLNSSLLLLSKIKNGQFIPSDEINIAVLVTEILEDLSLLAEAKAQQLQLRQSPASAITELHHVNKTLIKILISNLVTNAIQYSAKEAIIELILTPQGLEVINSAPAFPMTQDKLFKRFQRWGGQKGNGLGLSIAQSIARLHHYQLSYRYDQLAGTHHFGITWITASS